MNTLGGIGIKVVDEGRHGSNENAKALLHEIGNLLQQLLDKGETGVIDLRAIPLTPGEYHYLETVLGEGELFAELKALGGSTVRETAIPGVWWIVHYSSNGDVMADLLEVTAIPEILKSNPVDIKDGLASLRKQLDRERSAEPQEEE